MRVSLSSGKLVEVRFNYQFHEVPIKRYVGAFTRLNNVHSCPTEKKPYKTSCEITLNDQYYKVTSTCHKNDQFQKLKGRLRSYNMAMRGLNKILTKNERRELFHKVFPQFKSV